MTVIKGSDCKIRIKSDKRLKFPGKKEMARQGLDETIIEAGKWMDVSQLDTTVLTRIVEDGLWDRELIDEVVKYGKIEEVNTLYLSRLKDEGE